MFVDLRGILKASWDRGLYRYMLYIVISVIILILLTGFYVTLLLHTECYLVPFHHITLERWKEWYCVFYFTLIAWIRIWIVIIFTICMPFRLSKTKEQLWRREPFKSLAVKSVAQCEGILGFFIWYNSCLLDSWSVWSVWHLTWVKIFYTMLRM